MEYVCLTLPLNGKVPLALLGILLVKGDKLEKIN
jgi:hypothetical protein